MQLHRGAGTHMRIYPHGHAATSKPTLFFYPRGHKNSRSYISANPQYCWFNLANESNRAHDGNKNAEALKEQHTNTIAIATAYVKCSPEHGSALRGHCIFQVKNNSSQV